MIDAAALGENVAFYRRRRGLSQTQLATLLNRSESWVSQVERGARTVDRLSVLVNVGNVLGVSLSELAGDQTPFPVRPNRHPTTERLRVVLTTPHAIQALLENTYGDPASAPTVDQLRQRTACLWELGHRSAFADLSEQLAEILPELEQAVQRLIKSDRHKALLMLAESYQLAAAVFTKVGEPDAAWVAGDRALTRSEEAGEPLYALASAFRLTLSFLGSRQLDQARSVASAAASALAPYRDQGGAEAWSLWGALQLALAVTAARDNDATTARRHLAEARKAAKALGEDRNDFETEFGPTNVALHAVSIEVELGNAGEALRLAQDVDLDALSHERRGRFHIELALAHAQLRHNADALQQLLAAEAETAEQVQRHPRARQLVLDLLRSGRSEMPELAALAKRLELESDEPPVRKILDSRKSTG